MINIQGCVLLQVKYGKSELYQSKYEKAIFSHIRNETGKNTLIHLVYLRFFSVLYAFVLC